jgi:long-subunit acyl-CoA synthetase (AMP-forming)
MGAGRPGRPLLRRRGQRHLPTDAASQVHYLCEDSRTTLLFVEDDEQLDKALEVRQQLRGLTRSSCSTWKACANWTTRA